LLDTDNFGECADRVCGLEMDVGEYYDDDRDKNLVAIYKDCGWPSENFRKEECMERVKKALDE